MSEKNSPKAIINIFKQDKSIEENTKIRNQIGGRKRDLCRAALNDIARQQNDLINLKRLRSDQLHNVYA